MCVSFLLRFPSNRQAPDFTQAELKGIWHFVRRGYVRDRARAYVLRIAVLLLVAGGLALGMFSVLK